MVCAPAPSPDRYRPGSRNSLAHLSLSLSLSPSLPLLSVRAVVAVRGPRASGNPQPGHYDRDTRGGAAAHSTDSI